MQMSACFPGSCFDNQYTNRDTDSSISCSGGLRLSLSNHIRMLVTLHIYSPMFVMCWLRSSYYNHNDVVVNNA